MKRGQITVFLIIGVLMLFVTGGVFFVVNKVSTKDEIKIEEYYDVGVKADTVTLLFNSCIEQISEKGLKLIEKQGGFIEPVFFTVWDQRNIPYYWENGLELAPTVSSMENELNNYIQLNVVDCFRSSEIVSGYISMKDLPEIETKLLDEKLRINVNIDVEIVSGGAIKKLENFEVEVSTDLLKLYTAAMDFTYVQQDNELIDYSFLNSLAFDNDISSHVIEFNEGVILFLRNEAPEPSEIDLDHSFDGFAFAIFGLNGFEENSLEETLNLFINDDIYDSPYNDPLFTDPVYSGQPAYEDPYDFVVNNPLEAVRTNPALFSEYLIDNPSFAGENPAAYEEFIGKGIENLNNNLPALESYMSAKGAEFKSIKGSFTSFSDDVFETSSGTSFSVEQIKELKNGGFSDFEIDESGNLCYSGAENICVAGGEFRNTDGGLAIVSGNVDVGEIKASIDVAGDGEIYVKSDGEIKAKHRARINDFFLFSGEVTVNNENDFLIEDDDLNDNSRPVFALMKEGTEEKLVEFSVSKPTRFIQGNVGDSLYDESSIILDGSVLKIISFEENFVGVVNSGYSLSKILTNSLEGVIQIKEGTLGSTLRLDHGKLTMKGITTSVVTSLDEFVVGDEVGRCEISCVAGISKEIHGGIVDNNVRDLSQDLNSNDPNLRANALLTLSRQAPNDPVTTEALRNALSDTNSKVRVYAAARLAISEGEDVIESLTEAASEDSDPYVRRMAIRSIGRLDPEYGSRFIQDSWDLEEDSNVKLTMITLSDDKDFLKSKIIDSEENIRVRENAVVIFGKLSDDTELSNIVNNNDLPPEVIGTALFQLSPEKQIELGKENLNSESPLVRRVSSEVLRRNRKGFFEVFEATTVEKDEKTKTKLLGVTNYLAGTLGTGNLRDQLLYTPEFLGQAADMLSEDGTAGQSAFALYRKMEQAVIGDNQLGKESKLQFLNALGLDVSGSELDVLEQQLDSQGYSTSAHDVAFFINSGENLPTLQNLADEVESRLSEVEISERVDVPQIGEKPIYKESLKEYRDDFSTSGLSLSDKDLLKIKKVLDAMDDPVTKNQIGSMIIRDATHEHETELGGSVELKNGKAIFVEREPTHKHNNGNYAFSTETIHKSFEGIGQFHLHATDTNLDSHTFSGPSGDVKGGDLGAARQLRLDGVVITSIKKGKFNMDYYNGDGQVVDLGNYEYDAE